MVRYALKLPELRPEYFGVGIQEIITTFLFAFYFKNLKSYFKEVSTKAINNMTIILIIFEARFRSKNISLLTIIEMIKYFVPFQMSGSYTWKTRS